MQHRLSLGGVVTHVLLGNLSGLRSVLAGDLAQLLGLAVQDVGAFLHIVVDELLVRGIEEGSQEQSSSSNQGKAPVRNNLDKVVGDQSSNASLSRLY